MKRPNSRIILTLVAAMVALGGLMFLGSRYQPDHALAAKQQTHSLFAKAEARFVEMRGLAPCDPNDKAWILAADQKLRSVGKTPAETLIVIVPAFSDIGVISISPESMFRYRLHGSDRFDPDSVYEVSSDLAELPILDISRTDLWRLNEAILRNTRFAMSSRAPGGKDGVNYYFRHGTEHCASAWSPDEGTLGGHVTAIVDELSLDHAAAANVAGAIDSLESFEARH